MKTLTVGKIIKGKYFDSVTLMQISKHISNEKGVVDSSIVMGSDENKKILKSAKLYLSEFDAASDNDIIFAINGKENIVQTLIGKTDEIFSQFSKIKTNSKSSNIRTIEDAIHQMNDLNFAIISVAGKYAVEETKKALDHNLHVMLFSDNISINDEVMLKEYAKNKNLLVMGPDCGTAIINGVPLAFANAVNSGNIGIVAASGTGLQEVSSIISNLGSGISQAFGTGGRDVKKDVGGIMFLESLKFLIEDQQTEIIVLIAKPPHESVLKKIYLELEKTSKPVITCFLGQKLSFEEKENLLTKNIFSCERLDETANIATSLSMKKNINTDLNRCEHNNLSKVTNSSGKYLRGLFSGGTFVSEAQIVFSQEWTQESMKEKNWPIHSNVPLNNDEPARFKKLKNNLVSEGHTIIDLGEDEFTVGKPHPMIDFSTRIRRMKEEINNPEVALVLLDVVLGYGSNMNPAKELSEVIRESVNIKKIPVVLSVTGTNLDPQNRKETIVTLRSAGAIVANSNAEACKIAAQYFLNN